MSTIGGAPLLIAHMRKRHTLANTFKRRKETAVTLAKFVVEKFLIVGFVAARFVAVRLVAPKRTVARVVAPKRTVIVLAVTLLCSSCSTLGVRSDSASYGEFYPATKNDITIMNGQRPGSNWLVPSGTVTFFTVLDIPFSVLTDTVFLPIDLAVMAVRQEGEGPDAASREQEQLQP